jgi:phosphoribosyl 1,2-cyclic phosphodiesterase
MKDKNNSPKTDNNEDPAVEAEWQQLTQSRPKAELLAMIRKAEPRRRGRRGFPNRTEILDAAAKARAERKFYTHVAPRFNMTPKQLIELVRRNRKHFDAKVKEFQQSDVPSELPSQNRRLKPPR